MNVKTRLKQIPLVYALNARVKCLQLKRGRASLARHYADKASQSGSIYNEQEAIAAFHVRHHRLQPGFTPKKTGSLRIFWVGASRAQDESGFLQNLERFGRVTTFKYKPGGYGPLLNVVPEANGLNWLQIRRANDEALIRQVTDAHTLYGIDILIGQMWANLYSSEALVKVRAQGIPVINIAMDDRLPELWSVRKGYRMGSVGLGEGVDMILTTAPETCAWYASEKMPAIFWPLASDDSLFVSSDYEGRDIDVLFIGNRYGIRGKIVDYLSKRGISVTCYGGGWPNGYVNAEQNIALSKRAKIIMGVATVGHCSDVYTLKLRDFDALMTGALYITHRNPDLLKLFQEGRHLECYETLEELSEKISFYLVHPVERIRIGKSGQSLAMAEHSWNYRLSNTFSRLGLLQS